MEQTQHYVQDACELYAVAVLQRLAEKARISCERDSDAKFSAFHSYADERGLTESDFNRWPDYKANVERHLPLFFADLIRVLHGETMDFVSVETEFRNMNLKGDFVIITPTRTISVSFKNYCISASRPQCSSGTFNSFPLNFLFDRAGVGMFVGPDGSKFKGSSTPKRDQALEKLGWGPIVPLMKSLDNLNASIKSRFVYGNEFEFLDEGVFDAARKQVGNEGQYIVLDILRQIGADRVKARLLKMTSLDGAEEVLILDPKQRTDSITSLKFRKLRFGVASEESVVEFDAHGQSIRFQFVLAGEPLLSVDVPFTINKNGAWISETYEGERFHAKEGRMLRTGQRRPKKSKELATSTNTYVDFAAAGIFTPAGGSVAG